MAFWQKKGGKYVYVYVMQGGKQKPLPRRLTKNLDGEPDHNIQAWVDQYSRQFEKPKVQPDSILYSNDALTRYVEDYIAYRKSRKKSELMLRNHKRLLLDYVIPFFLKNNPPLKDPNQWPSISIRLLA